MERADVWQALRAGTEAIADPEAPASQKFRTDEMEALAGKIAARARRSLGEARARRGERLQASEAFLRGLLAGEGEASLSRRTRSAGLGEADAYAVVAMVVEDETAGQLAASLTGLLDRLAAGLPGAVHGMAGDTVALVVPVREDAPDALARAATDLAAFAHSMRAASVVAVGRSHRGITGSARSAREALWAIEAARRVRMEGTVVYEDVVVPRLLLASEDLIADLAVLLDPLRDAGGDVVTERLRILRAYLDHGCNATKAGTALGIPRETVRYRLGVLGRILGLRIERSWCVLQLALVASVLQDGDAAAGPASDNGMEIAVAATVVAAGEASAPALDRIGYAVRRTLGRPGAVRTFRRGDIVMALVRAGEGAPVDVLERRISEAIEGLPAVAGRPVASVARGGAGRAPRRALRVIDLLLEADALPAVLSYERALPFLVARGSPEIARDIVEIALGRLLRVDSPSRELFGTLAAYLEAGCSATEAARAVFIDPRTLHRRRAEAELVTGRRIADPHDRLLLEMGVRSALLGIANGAAGDGR